MNPNLALVTSGASAALTGAAAALVVVGLAAVVGVAVGVSLLVQALRAIAPTVESPAVVKNLRRENVLIGILD
jgi:hypothetical protein